MHTSILLDPVKSATQPTIPSDLTVVFTENHARLLKLARSMVRCPHAAEDVVQDAMLAALKSFGSFEGRSAAATWLHRIVVNTALMHLRRARTRRELGLEDVAAPVAPHADDPAVLAERDDACQRVHRCLAELSSMHRNVVELRDIKGLDTAAVANALGISENAAKIRLGGILSGLTRTASKRVFEPVPEPEEVANGLHLERLVRYVHLNPCRAKLTRDPLSWPWSTHRGLLGAELNPWVSEQTLGKVLGRPSRGLGTWLHGYVSGDPSVDVSGTPPPVPCAPREVCNVPLDAIRRAAFAATPWSPPTIRRRLVVQLALHQGWRDTNAIAHAAGLSTRTVRRIAMEPSDPALLRAAQLCLGDSRLLLPDTLIRPVRPLPRR